MRYFPSQIETTKSVVSYIENNSKSDGDGTNVLNYKDVKKITRRDGDGTNVLNYNNNETM